MSASLIDLAIVGGGLAGGLIALAAHRANPTMEIALVEAGVPEDQAACMAPRMTERLTPEQLRKLENVAPQDGEAAMPRDAGEALARIRRVNDPEVVEVTVRAAAACAFGGIFEKL